MDIEEKIILKKQIKNIYDLNEFYISVTNSKGYSFFSMDEITRHEEYYKPSARVIQDMATFINNADLPDKKITLLVGKTNNMHTIEEYYFKTFL